MLKNIKTESSDRAGFTLIELLVVIAIIGLLASIVLVSLSTARGKARDSKRLTDMRQLVTALDLYFAEHGTYPLCNSIIGGGDPFCGSCEANEHTEFETALQPLVAENYLAKIPIDPQNKAWCYTYEYYTSNEPDIWASKCSNQQIGNFYYILSFGTEVEKNFNLPEWVYQRTTGKEYCMTGYK